MEWKDKAKERKRDADLFFKNSIPIHIVTKSDSWINGYIIETPEEDFFYVLDRRLGKTKVLYRMIKSFDNCFTEFIGDFSSLPLPEKVQA